MVRTRTARPSDVVRLPELFVRLEEDVLAVWKTSGGSWDTGLGDSVTPREEIGCSPSSSNLESVRWIVDVGL